MTNCMNTCILNVVLMYTNELLKKCRTANILILSFSISFNNKCMRITVKVIHAKIDLNQTAVPTTTDMVNNFKNN